MHALCFFAKAAPHTHSALSPTAKQWPQVTTIATRHNHRPLLAIATATVIIVHVFIGVYGTRR
jgi:hypothetical protein